MKLTFPPKADPPPAEMLTTCQVEYIFINLMPGHIPKQRDGFVEVEFLNNPLLLVRRGWL